MNFLARQKKLREQLATTRFDALLISHLPNIRYLCGFTGSAGLLLVAETGSVFFTDVRYDIQGRAEVKGAKVIIARKALLSALAEFVAARRKKSKKWTIGIEAEHLTVAEKKRLTNLLPTGVGVRDASSFVERARMIKDDDELRLIRTAVQLGATLFERALKVLKPGVKESEVAAEMEYAARQAGAEEMSFPTIIASGARSALPHGKATEQLIAPGGFVVCDFGVILTDYCSDMTRTVYVGRPSAAERKVYEAVKQAQQAAVDAVAPGMSVSEVDRAAQNRQRGAAQSQRFQQASRGGAGGAGRFGGGAAHGGGGGRRR